MRFSLLTLLGLITCAAILISLVSASSKLRGERAELEITLAQLELASAESDHFQGIRRDLEPTMIYQDRLLKARTTLLEQVENAFHSQVTEQSVIEPVEGKVSVRAIPAFRRADSWEQGFMVHVSEESTCELEVAIQQDDQVFLGLEEQQRFALRTGLNKLLMSFEPDEGELRIVVSINVEDVASATADATEDRRLGWESWRYDKQREVTRETTPLVRFTPRIQYDDLEYEPIVSLKLITPTPDQSGKGESDVK